MFSFFKMLVTWAVGQIVRRPLLWLGGAISIVFGWYVDFVHETAEAVFDWLLALLGTVVEDVFALLKHVVLWLVEKAWELFHTVIDFVLGKIPTEIVAPEVSAQLHSLMDAANRWMPLQEAITIWAAVFTFWMFVAAFRWTKQLVPSWILGSR